MFCPNKRCSIAIFREGAALPDEHDACEECGASVCLYCKVVNHSGKAISVLARSLILIVVSRQESHVTSIRSVMEVEYAVLQAMALMLAVYI